MSTYRARCPGCKTVRVFMGRDLDAVRRETCDACQRRLTVIDHDEPAQPPAANAPRHAAPAIERAMWKPTTAQEERARELVKSALGEETEAHG